MKRKLFVLCAATLLTGAANVRGQSVGPTSINAAGGSGTAGSTKIEWSVGELAWVGPTTGTKLTQGVLQPKISNVSVSSTSFANQLQVFPNPANSLVTVKLNAEADGEMTYRLMDIAGRVIQRHTANVKRGVTTEQLNIAELAVATYMLQVTFTAEGSEESAAYQIQKLQ